MALANYTDLQASVIKWMTRTGDTDFVADLPDMIALAEARLNRELGVVETDAALVGVIGNRRIDISSLSVVRAIALFYVDGSGNETPIQKQEDGTYGYSGSAGFPTIWSQDGTNIDFNCPLDAAYNFRFRYRQKFNLATSPTNWLLTNHPDVYLAAALIWGAGYNEEFNEYGFWKMTLDEGIPSVRNLIKQSNRGTLRVDPALQARRHHFDYTTGE